VSSVIGPILLQEFLPGTNRTSPVSIVSLLPCRRQYPAGVNYPLSQSEIAHIVLTVVDRLDHRILILTRLAQRSLTLQPSNSLISPGLTLSVGFNMSITLHAATQARRLLAFTATGLLSPLSSMRVTLWITTAFHLDTPTKDVTSLFLRTMT
jgi:hypothetical protein